MAALGTTREMEPSTQTFLCIWTWVTVSQVIPALRKPSRPSASSQPVAKCRCVAGALRMLTPCSVAVQPKAGCSAPSHSFVLPSTWGLAPLEPSFLGHFCWWCVLLEHSWTSGFAKSSFCLPGDLNHLFCFTCSEFPF